ncbi:MAG TPA: hypothetical protein PK923_08310 [Bacteroidales bacterium]|nr:hypothetical protein [Bacteroidales bacterium]
MKHRNIRKPKVTPDSNTWQQHLAATPGSNTWQQPPGSNHLAATTWQQRLAAPSYSPTK